MTYRIPSRTRLWTGAILVLAFAGCKEAKITDVPVTVARVDVNPLTVTLKVGETRTVTAVAVSESGRQMTARTVNWISSNPNVVMVTPNGEITGVRVGNAELTASSGGATAKLPVTVTYGDFSLTINNLLISAVVVEYNGSPLATVGANATATFTVQGGPQITLEWAMIRPTLGINPLGEQPAGTFSLAPGNDTQFTFQIDNIVENTTYFAPLVSNNTTVRLLMGVNMGLVQEQRCNCVVLEGAQDAYFGYYTLLTNSNVRAYADGSSYTGPYVFWSSFTSAIVNGPGTVKLFTNIPPAEADVSGSMEPAAPIWPANGRVITNDRKPTRQLPGSG